MSAEATPDAEGEEVSLLEAQRKARKWADRALELSQVGEFERAKVAEVHAELWLSRMLKIEAQIQGEPPLVRAFRQFPHRARRLVLRTRTSRSQDEDLGFPSLPSMDQATITASVMLRAWKRSAS